MSATKRAVELMLSTGEWYTAGTLGTALGISSVIAGTILNNMRNLDKYQTEETPLPGRKVRLKAVVAVKHIRPQDPVERQKVISKSDLWRQALFGNVRRTG